MKTRHVFIVPHLAAAQEAIFAARAAGLPDDNLSLIARADIELDAIPDHRKDAATDFMPAALRGAVAYVGRRRPNAGRSPPLPPPLPLPPPPPPAPAPTLQELEERLLRPHPQARDLAIGRVADGSSSEEEEQGEKFHGNKTRQLARFTSHDSQALRIVASIFNLTILANKIVAQQFCWLLFRV